MERHSICLNDTLIDRLEVVWPSKHEYIYYVMLARTFPILQSYAQVPLDEFGPEIYRMHGRPTILLVLDRVYEKNKSWILVVSSEWLFTHKKNTQPRWILDTDLNNYTRFSRNELFLESYRTPII